MDSEPIAQWHRSILPGVLRYGLLDEVSLLVHPIVVGSDMRLFDEMTDQVSLELVNSSTLSDGVLAVTYQPATA